MNGYATEYTYDPALSFATNRDRALALHQKDGPMVPVVEGPDGDQTTTHWLFPSGASIGRDHLELPRLPGEGLRPGNCHALDLETAQRQILANKVEYWTRRLRQAEQTFKQAKGRATDSPTTEAAELVEAWRREVLVCRRMLAAANDALNPAPPPVELTPEQDETRRRALGERQALEDRIALTNI